MNTHKCEINDQMVHSCRVLLGARAAGYPDTPDNFDAQHLAHARRIKRSLDLVHAFAAPGRLPLEDRHVHLWARGHRAGRVVHNWKPVARWKEAETATARVRMRLAARRVRLLDRQVAIILHHEPENDLGQRGVRKIAAGTPEEYRRMWSIVREVFAQEGADDVVWGMAYMNYPKWDHLVADLYPGDELVDWVWCNAYGSPERPDLGENLAHFANLMRAFDIGRDKPWGVAEWSTPGLPVDLAADYFEQARAFLDTPDADAFKAWMVFDSPGAENRSDLRLGFDAQGLPVEDKLEAYQRFTRHPRFHCAGR